MLIDLLNEHVRAINSKKAADNLIFLDNRMNEAIVELEAVEDKLAIFLDENQSLGSANLKLQVDRHQRQIEFATQLVLNLQAQFTQAEIELQRTQPVISILDAPSLPISPSGPNRIVMILGMTLLGMLLGSIFAISRAYWDDAKHAPHTSARVDEISAHITNSRVLKIYRWLR